MSGRTPEELEAEIEAQRQHLADTVDQLATRLDVKSRAQAKLAELKERATTDAGKPRPELLAAGGSLVAVAVGLGWWWRRRGA